MPVTYVNIASQTLGSDTSVVTFSSIPSTYTDLEMRINYRGTVNNNVLRFKLGTDNSQFIYSLTDLGGQGGSVFTTRYNNNNELDTSRASQASPNWFANTFTPITIYIPNYARAINKPLHIISHAMNNVNSPTNLETTSALLRSTATITNMSFNSNAGGNIAAGSTFYLYGISNT